MESVVAGSGRIVRWEMVTPSGLGILEITSTSLKIEINGPEGLFGGGCSHLDGYGFVARIHHVSITLLSSLKL